MHKKLSIFYSALLLTGVNLLLRFVGTSFQVYLSSRIGPEGIGLLQLVLSVGAMSMVAGTAGIRTATMYLTAEESGRKRPENMPWVLSSCLLYSIVASAAVAGILYFTAPYLSKNWIGDQRTLPALRLYAALLPVNCLTGVMVGHYTGANRIGTLAAVEVAEQACSMICTLFLLQFWAEKDAIRACLSVILGSGIGSGLTLLCLMGIKYRWKTPQGQRLPVRSRLLHTAVPLAIADDLRTGISTLEQLMVPKRLAMYSGTVSALASFGIITGMVFPILMFPVAILFGLTELLIPELARCCASGSKKRIQYLVGKSLRVTILYGAACGGILYINAESLCSSLYNNADAGIYLRWFSLLSVMLYCDAVTDAMIKGLGQQKASVRYNIITNILDILLLYFWLPRYGVIGYFASFTVTHVVNFILSIGRLFKICGKGIPLSIPARTLSAAILSALVSGLLPSALARTLCFFIIYVSLLQLTQVVGTEDLKWILKLIKKRTESTF